MVINGDEWRLLMANSELTVIYPLVNCYITMEAMAQSVRWFTYILEVVIFNSYVKLPEGNGSIREYLSWRYFIGIWYR